MCRRIQQNLEKHQEAYQADDFMSCAFERVLVVSCTNTLGRKIGCTQFIVRSERERVNWRFDLTILSFKQ